MQSIVNFFLGNVLLEVRSAYPERFFNLCARNGIEFWDMNVLELGVFRVRMTVEMFRRLPSVSRRAGAHVHIIEKRGLPFFTNRFRKRWALVSGLALFCLAAWVFTAFVWVVNIDGFDGLDNAKLMSALREAGLSVGTYAQSVNIGELRNSVLIKMPELSYVSVNFRGSHANVTVRKRAVAPEILEEDIPCDIIADKDGAICDITVKSGSPEVVRGDVVTRGQILASGYITGRAGSTVLTHADAEIRARIWRKKSARIMRGTDEKRYTGDEKARYTIILFGNRIKLYFNSGISYTKCDKIIKRTDLTLFGRLRLPLSLERATYREYETERVQMTEATAYDMLSAGLNQELRLPEGAELVNADFITSADERFAYGTLKTESIEKIGVKRKIETGDIE